MFLALEPSRETPQSTRTTSSGTHLRYQAITMARQAAPHSRASICMTTGTRATPFFRGCLMLLEGKSLTSRQSSRKLMGLRVSVTICASYTPSGSASAPGSREAFTTVAPPLSYT